MYNSVGFQYKSDYYDPSQPTEEEEPQRDKDDKESSDLEDNEEPFIAPEGLNVPPDVELPPTAKMHAIIERTANFVCKQGAQFEIMLKAKQARNSQFDFLRFDHYLNPYYKHIQKAMKEGRYTQQAGKQNEQQKKSVASSANNEEEDDDDDDDDEGGDYLHPSLFASKRCSRLEELTKPLKIIDPDHPLAALVRKAQSEKLALSIAAAAAAPVAPTESTADTTVTSTFYNYYMLPDGTYCLAPPPPAVDTNAGYSSLPTGESAQSATEAVTAPQSSISASLNNDDSGKLILETPTASSLTPVVAIIPPPPDIQPVIDKLAQYVARNGIKFETSVRAKNDTRFDFLQPWHQYNPYYEFKKHFFMQKEGIAIPQSFTTSDASCISTEFPNETLLLNNTVAQDGSSIGDTDFKMDAAGTKPVSDGKLMKVSFAPISFAIKVKETDLLPLEKNRVKLDDDSDEEEDEEGKPVPQNKTSSCFVSHMISAGSSAVEEKRPQLTPEELEAKQAKQKLEDRLAAAAREKLAQAAKESKEKQLQAERKRKAALFLQTLKSPLEMELGKIEENSYSPEALNSMNCDFLPEDTIVPTTEYPVTHRSPSPRFPEQKAKKKKKRRERSRSRSPKIQYESKSRTHSKQKHSLPTAYRTVRRSRSRSRSPRKPSQSSDRRREDERDRNVAGSYYIGHSPGNSRKHLRNPHENRKKKHSRTETKSKARSRSRSPNGRETHSLVHSSISPMESRGSSQEHYRDCTRNKDGHIASEIVSSVQSKITQDLMAKVRAMLAASKNMRSGAS